MPRKTTDRSLTAPRHFHARVYCFVSQDAQGSFIDSQHNEVLGFSVESCIRKAKERSEPRQRDRYHIGQLTECADADHVGGLED